MGSTHHKVFMTRGDGEYGYGKNSTSQRNIVDAVVFPVLAEALKHVSLPSSEKPIVVADLGSSFGPNAIVNASFVVELLRSRCVGCRKASEISEISSTQNSEMQVEARVEALEHEFQVYFNDLPSNDFNSLFTDLCDREVARSKFFVAGVPGCFTARLFPRSSVHVFVSMLSLHYLSRVPSSITDQESPAFNKVKLWVEGSTDATAEAYKEQFYTDLKSFLHARSNELVPGGILSFIVKSRRARKANVLQGAHDSIEALEICIRETVDALSDKGFLKEQQLNAFNIPMYFPSFENELLDIVKGFESAFDMLTAEEIGFPMFLPPGAPSDPLSVIKTVIRFARGIFGGMFEVAMGRETHEIFWQHFARFARMHVFQFTQVCYFGCISVSKR